MVIESLLDRYIRNEGFKLDLYKDTKGYLTGGVGHKMLDADIRAFNPKWSNEKKIVFWLTKFQEDYYKAKGQAIQLVSELNLVLNARQLEIITELKFNMGHNGFSAQKWPMFFQKLKDGDLNGAAYELLHNSKGGESKWLRDVGDRARTIADELRKSND